MHLVIVESATKAKKIQGFLGDDYKVIASFGHIVDLPPKELGVNTSTWDCDYVPTKPEIIKKIKDSIAKADSVYLASDPDREGHAIAYHISKLIPKKKEHYRIVFNEITKNAIKEAIKNKSDIDMNMFHSQECRRILDRLCGYCLSPLLWNEYNNYKLSCGRVQSCVLGFCVERLNDILNHSIEIKYEIKGNFLYNDDIKLNNCHNDKYIFTDETKALERFNSIDWENYKITYKSKDTKKNPSPPYVTTSIQIDSHKVYHISAKECMNLLQTLYENGCITYHRTDSVAISNNFKQTILKYIKTNYGDDYIFPRDYKTHDKNAQEAHECIRVTNLETVSPVFEGITDKHKKIYGLIWKRTVACQMSPAIYKEYSYEIKNTSNDLFKTSSSALIFKGFLALDEKTTLDDINKYELSSSNPIILKELNCIPSLKSAKSLYTDGELIKEMENKGVGRPSTYATTISILYDRGYVEKGQNPNKEVTKLSYKLKGAKSKISTKEIKLKIASDANNLIRPTETGINVYKYLLSKCDFVTNPEFTKIMEDNLDKVATNTLTNKTVLNSFNEKLQKVLTDNPIKKNYTNDENIPYKVLKTKYGNCIFVTADKKFINIDAILEWKNGKTLTKKEIEFIISLPKAYDDTYDIYIGRYGLYLKDKEGNNKGLDKGLWSDLIKG